MAKVRSVFVPSLLKQADPRNLWTYMSSQVHITTLCHSWLFRDGAPAGLFETITVNVLKAMEQKAMEQKAMERHDEQTLGHVRIHHIVCFKTMMSVQLGTVVKKETGEKRESFVEVFIALIGQNSPHAVASNVMKSPMQRVVVRYAIELKAKDLSN
jgi:ABC-type transporter MlaC component